MFESIKEYEKLYKLDSKGTIRVWWCELGANDEECASRVNSGIDGGQIVTSEWKVANPTNLGKANERDTKAQAEFEIEALYTKKKKTGYFENTADVKTFDKFKPMLAIKFEDLKNFDPDTNPVYSQPKLDGIRCIARKDGLWTRSGEKIHSCPHIERELEKVFEMAPTLVLDGELYNHDLKDNFNELTSIIRREKLTDEDLVKSKEVIQYHVYDAYDSGDSNMKFSDRYSVFYALIRNAAEGACVVPVSTSYVTSRQNLDDIYGYYLESGYEGQMIRIDEKYENKRSKFLTKRKEFVSEEFEVISVEEGQGNWSGHVKRFILKIGNADVTFGAGVRGSQEVLKKLLSEKKPDWATVRYQNLTPDGIPRFPVVIDWGYGSRKD